MKLSIHRRTLALIASWTGVEVGVVIAENGRLVARTSDFRSMNGVYQAQLEARCCISARYSATTDVQIYRPQVL